MNTTARRAFFLGWTVLVSIFAAGSAFPAGDLQWEIQSLERDLTALEQRYTEKHPDVRALRQRIERLKKEAGEERAVREKPRPLQRAGESGGEGSAGPGSEPITAENLRVPIQVVDRSGLGFGAYPVSTVVPIPAGLDAETKAIRVVDALGRAVPAQFSALSGGWGDGGSSRYLAVTFLASAPPYRGEGSSGALFFLTVDRAAPPKTSPLVVQETPEAVTVVTGPLKFVIDRKGRNLLSGVWLDRDGSGRFEGDEAVVVPQTEIIPERIHGKKGGKAGAIVVVEEAGPLRAVIRTEVGGETIGRGDRGGVLTAWITAYAGLSLLEITTHHQQASPQGDRGPHSAPPDSALTFRLGLREPVTVTVGLGDGMYYRSERGPGMFLAQEGYDRFRLYDRPGGNHLRSGRRADGYLDVSGATHGVTAMVRHFAETWPNVIAVDAENTLRVPTGSKRMGRRTALTGRAAGGAGTPSRETAEIFTVKEIQLFFHGPRTAPEAFRRLCALFDTPPEAFSPVWSALSPASVQ